MSYTLDEFGLVINLIADIISQLFTTLDSVIIVSSPIEISFLTLLVGLLTIHILMQIIFMLNGSKFSGVTGESEKKTGGKHNRR